MAEQRIITLEGKNVEYTLRTSVRATRIRLAIYPGGDFVVTMPVRVSEIKTVALITDKSAWVLSTIEKMAKVKPLVSKAETIQEYAAYKDRAYILVKEKVIVFNALYKFSFGTITIKNQKTLWGSCSRNGNLNFNYKIALLPEHLANYIVVHELCHLKEFNHGKNFWNLVACTIPHYKEYRIELKKTGLRFT